jgi:hypothetical protein
VRLSPTGYFEECFGQIFNADAEAKEKSPIERSSNHQKRKGIKEKGSATTQLPLFTPFFFNAFSLLVFLVYAPKGRFLALKTFILLCVSGYTKKIPLIYLVRNSS